MWCIPPKQDAAFVCAMEDVLAVYQRPYDALYPVVCMDETSKQCVKEVRPVLPGRPGQTERYDVEYERNTVRSEVDAWTGRRNENANSNVDWQFTTGDARIKLKHLYPAISH